MTRSASSGARRARASPTGLPAWLTSRDFAALVAVTHRAAARILARAHAGLLWHEHRLSVRRVKGRGGSAGYRYEVERRGLPVAFQLTPRDPLPPPIDEDDPDRLLRARERASAVVRTRYEIVIDILSLPENSAARGHAVEHAARRHKVNRATIYRWMHNYLDYGLAGLAPAQKKRAAKPLLVSRAFDRAFEDAWQLRQTQSQDPAGCDRDDRAPAAFRDAVDTIISACWAERDGEAGQALIRERAAERIRALCCDHGLDIPAALCRPSQRRILVNRRFELLRVAAHDARRFDGILPRVTRTTENLAPMDVVFVDVKLADVFVPSRDGEQNVRPALITFYDAATRRALSHVVRLRPKVRRIAQGKAVKSRDGVTAEMVSLALILLLQTPGWGLPRVLYTDNGSEMAGLDEALINLSLALSCKVRRATPGNPQTKPVEGFFSVLNRTVFNRLPGFTGGKASAKRSRAADRYNVDPVPYWEDYGDCLASLLDDYHQRPGQDGKSPSQLFEDRSERHSFTPRLIDDTTISKAFGDLVRRRVGQASVVVKGAKYTADILCQDMPRTISLLTTADVYRAEASGQPAPEHSIYTMHDNLVRLQQDHPFDMLDPETLEASPGAVESDRRKNLMLVETVRQLLRVGANRHPANAFATIRTERARRHTAPGARAPRGNLHVERDYEIVAPSPSPSRAIDRPGIDDRIRAIDL